MTVSIHIEAMSAEEARETMRALFAGVGFAEPGAAHTAPAVDVSSPAPKPTRRGRKPAPEPEQPVTDIDASGDEVPAGRPERQPSEDDVRAAIRGLVKAHGENAAWALLDKYGATKRSEIKDTRGFVEEAEYLVGLAFNDVVKRLPKAAKPEEKPEEKPE